MGFALKTVAKKTETPAANDESGSPQPAAAQTAASSPKPVGFLKTGAQAVQAMKKADAEAKARKEKAGRPFRFWLKAGEDANITFLDGRIDPDTGILDIPYANEHRVKIDGRWEDVLCTEDHEPCPLCAAGEKRAFIGFLSIIDHREREWEKDGKTVKQEYTKRIYAAKSETLKQLTKMAEKRENGLVGVTYEVSRTGDKKAAVGDLFDRIAEHEPSDVIDHFAEDGKPFNYGEVLVYHTADELSALGIGKKVATIGSGSFGKPSGKKADDLDENKAPW